VLEILIHLIIAAHGAWGSYEERSLVVQVDQLRSRGEPMWPQDFTRAKIPDAQNAAFFLRAAHGALETKGEDWQRLGEISFTLPLSKEDAAVLERVVEANVEALRLVESAQALKEANWGITYATPMIQTPLPDLSKLADLRRLVDAQVTLALHRGEYAKAAAGVRDLMTISRGAGGMEFLVGHLVALSAAASAAERAEALGQAADPKDVATVEALRKLIDELLEEKELRAGWRRALMGERAVFTEVVLNLDKLRGMRDAPAGGPMGYLGKPLVMRDGMFLVWHVEGLIKAVDAKDLPAYMKAAQAAGNPQEESYSFRMLHMMSSMLMPAHEKIARRHFLVLADRRMAATALAIRLYALENGGNLPKTLDELVPKYLPAAPLDPLSDGKRIGYDSQRQILWSVGENGRDDGGSEKEVKAGVKTRFALEDLVVHLSRQGGQ
jgi:hypothetical protein